MWGKKYNGRKYFAGRARADTMELHRMHGGYRQRTEVEQVKVREAQKICGATEKNAGDGRKSSIAKVRSTTVWTTKRCVRTVSE